MTPETILGALCCIVMVLVVLRLLVGRRPKAIVGPDLGASMTIGSREVQEDCYDTLSTPSGLLIVLADGMGKAYGGRIASRLAVETFVDLFRDYNAFDNPQYYFRKAFAAANRAILNALENERRGAASVCAAMVKSLRLPADWSWWRWGLVKRKKLPRKQRKKLLRKAKIQPSPTKLLLRRQWADKKRGELVCQMACLSLD